MRAIKIRRCILAIASCLLLAERTTASYCYPDYCQNSTDLVPTPDFQCLLTQVQKGKGCTKLEFKDMIARFSKPEHTAVFTLRAYIFKFDDGKATAFNLSITDINFHSLVTRYQHIVDEDANACRHVKLYGNSSHPAPKNLYISCPFTKSGYEGSPYRLEYIVTDGIYSYSKRYIFYVPHHRNIENDIDIKSFTPFIYVDVSDPSNLVLYVQPLPPRYNVTKYRAWLIRNDTEWTFDTIIYANDDRDRDNNIRYNFTLSDGVYYIKVAALHPECDEYGCVNSTSPYINTKNMFNRLLIMIISTAWIPFALFFLFVYISDLHRKRALKCLMTRPNCLLIYSATKIRHVYVVTRLGNYLRSCNINVMMDICRSNFTEDPKEWCKQSFQKADVVLIVSSPSCTPCPSIAIERNADKHVLQLVRDHHSQKKKRYYAVHLPYCDMESPLPGISYENEFFLPKDLRKLVKAIHFIGYIRLFWPSDRSLLNDINNMSQTSSYSPSEISMQDSEIYDSFNHLFSLPNESPPIIVQNITNQNVDPTRFEHRSDTDIHIFENPIRETYTTDINELDLLGERRRILDHGWMQHSDRTYEIDEVNTFHINKLNL